MDYGDTSLWRHADLTAADAGVQAYAKNSSIAAGDATRC